MNREELIIFIETYVLNKSGKFLSKRLPEKEKRELISFTNFYNYFGNTHERIRFHFLKNNITDLPKCEECGNNIKITQFADLNIKKYCSTDCARNSETTKKKTKETFMRNYGVDHPSKVKEIKEKKKETFMRNYGVEHPCKTEEIKKKIKNTNIERYGTAYSFQNDDIKEKIKQTNLEKYGNEYAIGSEEIRNKIKETNIKKFNYESPFHNPVIQENIKQINLERYGVKNPQQNDSIKEKTQKTNLEKYGTEYAIASDEIQEKIKKINLEKYGNEYPFQSDVILKKTRETNLERYGCEYGSQRQVKADTLSILSDKEKFSTFIENKTVYLIAKELEIDNTTVYNYINKYELHDCYQTRGPSYLETEMKEFLDDLKINYEINNRSILNGKELDFYIPEYNLAIEMNGIYYHSDKFKTDPKYHYNKWKACNELGIHLVSIFEDDWNLQCDKIKNMLLNFFNKKSKGVPARKTYINKISGNIAKEFLNQHHLQGYVSGTHFGAFDTSDNLVGMMTFGNTRNGRFELKRFVTDNYTHPGLFSKLFKHAQKELNFTEVVSFSDNTCFTGSVYKKNGFHFVGVLKQDYRYLFNNKRLHKSNFKKVNIKKKFPELCESIDGGMTEREAMELLGIPKIWDCGKCEWVWKLNK